MATIKALLNRFENLNTDAIVAETMQESADAIAEKNKEQLYSGEDADGAEITPGYRPLTIAIKQSKGQPTDRVTLRDTGSFYQGIYVSVNGDRLITDSRDTKSAKLQDKYGEKIFGLNDKFSFEVIKETIRPVFKNKIQEAVKLVMK